MFDLVLGLHQAAIVLRRTLSTSEARRQINTHPLISKYFRIATPAEMIPAEYRKSGFTDWGAPGWTMTDTMGALGFTNAAGAPDPTKAIQQIIRAVPPGQYSQSGEISPQEVAAINLATELYRAGGTNMKEGQWESMLPDEQQSLLGVMDFAAPGGGDRYLQQLGRTRIPTRSNVFGA